MIRKESWPGHPIKVVGNKPKEVQPVEPQLSQPEVAREANEIIDVAINTMKKNPKFLAALAEEYFAGDDSNRFESRQYVAYPDEDGNKHIVVFEKKNRYIDEGNIKRQKRSFSHFKYIKKPDGSYNDVFDTSVTLTSVYRGTEPEIGHIASNGRGSNTPSIIREVREIVAENFGNSVRHTQPYK
jgi:hypothetical protein